MQNQSSKSSSSTINNEHQQNNSYHLSPKKVLKSSLAMSGILLVVNILILIISLNFLIGDVYTFLIYFFFLESGILFLLSGLYAIFGMSPSINLLLGKLFRDEERPLRMQQIKAIHRAIDYFVSGLLIFLASYIWFKLLLLFFI